MIDREILIWCAGLFDGEGCLSSSMSVDGNVTLSLSLGMSHEPSVRRFAEAFGLGVYEHRLTKVGRKRMWNTWASGPAVALIVQQLKPYLFTKTRQAEIALLLAQHLTGRCGQEPTEEENLQRLKLSVLLRASNHEGRRIS